MSHPCLYFIRYLLCTGRTEVHDMSWLRSTLRIYGLYDVQDEGLFKSIRDGVEQALPVPFLPSRLEHTPSQKAIKDLGVKDLFQPDEDVAAMQRILTSHTIRNQVEVALLGKVPFEEISSRISSRFKVELSPRTVERFHHFYFNVSLISMDEWARLLEENEAGAYGRQMALIHGSNMALHQLGYQTTLDSRQVLRGMFQRLWFRFQELRDFPANKDVVAMESTLAGRILAVEGRLRESDLALREVLDQFKKFQMERDVTDVADVRQLAAQGSFSGSEDQDTETEVG